MKEDNTILLDVNGLPPPRAMDGGDAVANPKPSVTWESAIDFASQALQFIQHGGSFNVTSEPYLSGVSVSPAVQASIPVLPILGIAAATIALIWAVNS